MQLGNPGKIMRNNVFPHLAIDYNQNIREKSVAISKWSFEDKNALMSLEMSYTRPKIEPKCKVF